MRPQKNADRVGQFPADRTRALNVRSHNDVLTAPQSIANAVQRNAVAIELVHDGVLEELVFFEQRVVFRVRQKVVVDAVLFALSPRPRGRGHAIGYRKVLELQSLDEGGLADARWTGE